MTPELKEKYDAQTKENYAAIGKACVDFEHICHSLRFGIVLMLDSQGLSNQRVSQVMLAELTAHPLLGIYQALLAETLEMTAEERKIGDKLCKQVKNLIERRNDIVHATWFVGFAGTEDTDFSEIPGHKWTRGKSGSELKGKKFVAKDFVDFAAECSAVSDNLKHFPTIVITGFTIANNFSIDNNGNVARPTPQK